MCVDNFPSFIEKERWPANSPDLNSVGLLCMGRARAGNQMELRHVEKDTYRRTQRAVKRIREDVVFERCMTWTNRLFRISQNGGAYLR